MAKFCVYCLKNVRPVSDMRARVAPNQEIRTDSRLTQIKCWVQTGELIITHCSAHDNIDVWNQGPQESFPTTARVNFSTARASIYSLSYNPVRRDSCAHV